MLNRIIENKLLLISIHIVIGYLATFSFFPKIFGAISIVVPIIYLISQKNFNLCIWVISDGIYKVRELSSVISLCSLYVYESDEFLSLLESQITTH